MTEVKDSDSMIGQGGKVHEIYPKGHGASIKKERTKKVGLTKRGAVALATATALGGAAAGAIGEATTHLVENSPPGKIIKEFNEKYNIGEPINPGTVYDVRIVNRYMGGELVVPKALVTIDGKVREVSLSDLGSFDRNNVRGGLWVDQGGYRMNLKDNKELKLLLANNFKLPSDLKAKFNHIQVEEGLEPRAVYFVPSGLHYTEGGRDFPVRFPLSVLELSRPL